MGKRIKGNMQQLALHQKLFFGIFIGCFCVGIIFVNIIDKKYLTDVGIFGEYFFMRFKMVDIQVQDLFMYILEKRMVFLLILFALGLTSLGVIGVCGYIGWFGFSAGILLSLAAREQGILGVLVCILGVLPQFLVYIPAGYLFLKKVYQISIQLYFHPHDIPTDKNKRQLIFAYFLVFLIVVLLFFIGIFLESYVNPGLLKKVMQLI